MKKDTVSIVVQYWEESERNWGVRPDGLSLHLTSEDCSKYIKQYWDRMPPGEAPDEYSRPWGHPKVISVSKSDPVYKELVQKMNKESFGLRVFTPLGSLSKSVQEALRSN